MLDEMDWFLRLRVMRKLSLITVLLLMGTAWSVQAANVSITFDGIPPPSDPGDEGLAGVSAPYVESGFSMTTNNPGSGGPDEFEFTSIHSDSSFYAGSISLAIRDTGEVPILSQVGGGAFDLIAIDLDNIFGASGTVNFTGTLSGGGTVLKSFVVDGTPTSMETFSFIGLGFTNLTSVTWSESAGFHHWDNIVVAAIPEPATVGVIMGMIFFGVAILRRRAVQPVN